MDVSRGERMAEKYDRELRGYFTETEYQEIMAWIKAKKRFSKPSHLIRFAIYSIINQNRVGAHHATTGRPPGRPHGKASENPGAGLRPGFQGNSEKGTTP
jgi:hypothetical protein